MKKSRGQMDLERQNLVDSRLVYRGRIVNLRLDTYQIGKKTKIAEIVGHPGAVVILPVDEKGCLLLIQQWRRAASEILIELPAGGLEEKELPESAAQRELQEETGFAAKTLTALGGFFSTPGFCNEYLHFFVAEDLYPSPLSPDEDEWIDLLPTPLPDAIGMIENNKIRDAKTISGIFIYQLWKARCEKL